MSEQSTLVDEKFVAICREVEKAYHLDDVKSRLAAEHPGLSFDDDTLGEIVVCLERNLSNLDSYYGAYWVAVDAAISEFVSKD